MHGGLHQHVSMSVMLVWALVPVSVSVVQCYLVLPHLSHRFQDWKKTLLYYFCCSFSRLFYCCEGWRAACRMFWRSVQGERRGRGVLGERHRLCVSVCMCMLVRRWMIICNVNNSSNNNNNITTTPTTPKHTNSNTNQKTNNNNKLTTTTYPRSFPVVCSIMREYHTNTHNVWRGVLQMHIQNFIAKFREHTGILHHISLTLKSKPWTNS